VQTCDSVTKPLSLTKNPPNLFSCQTWSFSPSLQDFYAPRIKPLVTYLFLFPAPVRFLQNGKSLAPSLVHLNVDPARNCHSHTSLFFPGVFTTLRQRRFLTHLNFCSAWSSVRHIKNKTSILTLFQPWFLVFLLFPCGRSPEFSFRLTDPLFVCLLRLVE